MFRTQPHNWYEARLCFEGDDGGGSGGSGGNGGDGRNRLTAAELMARYGASPERLAEQLEKAYGENYSLREKNRGLGDQVKALEGNQKPEGAVILTGDEATAYEAYKGLGKPDEIKTALDERQALSAEVATAKRDGTLRDAAGAAGFKFAVLKDRAGELPIEIREVEVQGKKVNRAFIKPEGGQEAELTAYAEQHWGDYLPALKATEQGQGQRSSGVTYPAQQSSGSQGNPPNAAQAYLNQTYGKR
jgi:hypothetical protein